MSETGGGMHAATTTCNEAGFKMYSTTDGRRLPGITYLSGEPSYGVVSTDVNSQLRLPQARPMTIESFNSGCVNPHGCVSGDGFTCAGPVKSLAPAVRALYAELNSPFAPGSFELKPPPSYVVGVKASGINSVLGWQQGPDGKPIWHRDAVPSAACLSA